MNYILATNLSFRLERLPVNARRQILSQVEAVVKQIGPHLPGNTASVSASFCLKANGLSIYAALCFERIPAGGRDPEAATFQFARSDEQMKNLETKLKTARAIWN